MSAEWDEQDYTYDTRVRDALGEVANHIASYKVAVEMGMPADVLDRWSSETYARVNELLTHEDLVYVTIRVMDDEGERRARRMLGRTPEKARCKVCAQEYALTKRGLIRAHVVGGKVCPGSRRPVSEYLTIDQAKKLLGGAEVTDGS